MPLLPQRSDGAYECHVRGAVARRIAGGHRAGNGAEQQSQISAATQGRFPDPERCHAAVARSFGIGWTETYLQSLYDQFVADRTGDSPEPSWIEPMQARYVVARDGTIAYVDINTDYRVAPELAAAMAALRRL